MWNLDQARENEADSHGIIGTSRLLTSVMDQVGVVAPTTSTVLIQGETGTGKELIAQAIHNLSPRRQAPLVTLNCAAIPAGLIESELFGHERGAFTGALTQRMGRFEMAHGGTLFLDEIGDLALDLQVKLLRVLQEQEFERLGGTRSIQVDVRLVAGHQSRSGADGERQAISRGLVLPAGSISHSPAAAAGPQRGYSGSGPALYHQILRAAEQSYRRYPRRNHGCNGHLQLAGQYPGIAELH